MSTEERVRKAPDWAVLSSAAGFTIWGFSLLLTRVGQRYASPMVLLSVRFLLAFLLLNVPLLLLGKEKLRLRGRKLRPLVVLGILEPLCFVFESYAIYFTNATVTGVVSALSPIVAMALAALLLRERPTRHQALFSLLPVAGVIVLTVGGQQVGAVSWMGIPFLIAYSIGSGYYKVANRSAADFSPYERTYVLLLSCAVFFTAAALIENRGDLSAYAQPLHRPQFIAVVLLLSVFCSIAANMLVNYGAGRISVTKMSAIGNINTVISAFAGVVFLREPFTWVMLLGAVLVLTGVREVTKQGV